MSAEPHETQGFVAIYRWAVADEHVAAFRQHWAEATDGLMTFASNGSLLGKAEDGSLIGIALWPDRETRDRAFAAFADGTQWPPNTQLEPMLVEVIDDRWVVSPFVSLT